MDLDPDLLKELISIFKSELSEQSQVMTEGLLKLEKNNLSDDEYHKTIDAIFRSAHNIKGASKGIGVTDVGDISHHLETLFSSFRDKTKTVTPDIIDICLDAVDKLELAMQAYIEKTPLPFDLQTILNGLAQGSVGQAVASTTVSKPSTVASKVAKPKKIAPEDRQLESSVGSRESIRVSIDNLDRVSALMEEIQVNKIAIGENYKKFSNIALKIKKLDKIWKESQVDSACLDYASSDSQKKMLGMGNDEVIEIQTSTEQLNKIMQTRLNELTLLSNSLQDEIRMLRLVPANTLFRNFPRLVRSLAHDLHKKVELEIKGDDVKMDKMVLESLYDPLIHLLRNAIDHGIESLEVRNKNGKTNTPMISMNVVDEGNEILITIHDNGAGIDISKVKKTAESKNILSTTEMNLMQERDILDLIFRPGFSTKDIITSVSGRGIGLDVVKSNITDIKGSVSVETELGKGTTFYLRVPLTLSSERGLMVRAYGQSFVIPTSSIERVLTLNPQEVVEVEASQAVMLDGIPIPLRTLATLLDLKKADVVRSQQVSIVVIKKGWHTLALLVDEIMGEFEIVIKPLQSPLTNMNCIAGGTLSSSGSVIIVLNTSDIIKTALDAGRSARVALDENSTVRIESKPHVLVVDDSITTRALEQNILENKGYKVTVAVNGKDAWELLQRQAFALLITDINMPIMDGFSLTERVKQNEKLRDLPVVIVTSLGSDAEKKRGIEVGANAYIVKNEFESDALLEIVSQLI